jgi:hypothetical protein
MPDLSFYTSARKKNSSQKRQYPAMNWISLVLRTLSIPSALIALLIFTDCIVTHHEIDRAIVKEKFVSVGSSTDYYVKAKGKYSYSEPVSKAFYEKLNVGDDVVIRLTPFLKEWKSIELMRGGVIIASTTGTDMYYMSIMGIALLIPLLSFKSYEYIRSQIVLMIVIPLFEFIYSDHIQFFLVWVGIFDKV